MDIDSKPTAPIAGVLFDLDGTLLDTAPDLIAAVNQALREAGFPPFAEQVLRPMISRGIGAMLGCGIGGATTATEDLIAAARRHYGQRLTERSRFMPGAKAVLDELDHRGIRWGIVTNKHACFTDPLLIALGLAERTGCAISGDTTAERKPHPLPLLSACAALGLSPSQCVYVGDSPIDIQTGRRAGTTTLAAAYGYLDRSDDPSTWGADGLLWHPGELIDWLGTRTLQ